MVSNAKTEPAIGGQRQGLRGCVRELGTQCAVDTPS